MRNATARRVKGYEHEVEIRSHRFTVDETKDDGGGDAGPRPTELLAASLATCTAITIEMYANRKEWDVGQVEVAVDYETPTADDPPKLAVKIQTPADLTDDQRERILTIAGKCPVHRTLASQDVKIEDSLEMIEG
jgi:putative redox protein